MLVSHLILLPNSMHHPNHGDKSEKRVDFSSHLNLSYYEKTAQNGSTLHILVDYYDYKCASLNHLN